MKVKLILFIVFCTFLFGAESILTCKNINECSAQTGCGISYFSGSCRTCWATSGMDATGLHYFAGGRRWYCNDSVGSNWGDVCSHIHM